MICDCENHLKGQPAAVADTAVSPIATCSTATDPTAACPTIASSEALLAQWQQQLVPQPAALPPEPCEIATARQLCDACRIRLKPKAALLLDADATPRQFYDSLMNADCLAAARRVLAHAMPKRRALWWGCLVAMDVDAHEPTSGVDLILPAVVRFVIDPSEENRRGTQEVAQHVPASSLAGSLAMAAFLSGGSISLPNLPVVHPRAFVTGRLVGVTVYLASVIRSAAHYKDHLRHYLDLGEQVARGQLLWNTETTAEDGLVARCDDGRREPSVPDPHYAIAATVAEEAKVLTR